MRRVLVTGATGFVGQHLCPALLAAGFAVRGIYRKSPTRGAWPGAMEWMQVPDIGPETEWTGVLQGVDYVVHLAGLAHRTGAKDDGLKEAFDHVNARGTAKLVDAVRRSQVARLVFISSAKVLPAQGTNKTGVFPDSNYGRSKLAAEGAISEGLAGCATDWCTLRPCLVYGPGNLGNMARLICLINTGLPLPFASIRNQKSFLYVGNLISAIQLVLIHPAASRRTFTLSDGEPVSTPELLFRLGHYARHRVRLFPMPVGMMQAVALLGDRVKEWTGISIGWDSYSVDRLCSSLTVDGREFFEELDWIPPYTAEEGMRITMTGGSPEPSWPTKA